MARGKAAEDGTERVAKNGYTYVKAGERGWVLKHWIVAEATLGRHIDNTRESVRFKDGKKDNFNPDNIIVIPKGTVRLRSRIASVEARLIELKAEHKYLLELLAKEQA